MKYTDLVMLDIKHIDEEQHKILTGCTNKNYPCHGPEAFRYGRIHVDPSRTGSGNAMTGMTISTGWLTLSQH